MDINKKNKLHCKNSYIKIFSIFIGLFILLQLSLNIDLKFTNASNGSIQVYYSNSNEISATLMEYDTMWQPIDSNSTNLKFRHIPLLTDTLRIDIDGTDKVSIQELSINLGKICLKKYDAESLYQSISTYEKLELSLDNGFLTCKVLESSAFFKLLSFQYFHAIYMAVVVIFLLGISLVICCIWSYCDDKYADRENDNLLLISTPMAMFIIIELLNSNYWYIDIKHRIVNCLILIVLYNIVYICLARKSIAIFLCNLVLLSYGIANYYVIRFRGKPILPTDIYAISTALYVSKGYSFSVSKGIFLSIIGAIGLWIIYLKNHHPRKFQRKSFVISVVMLSLLTGGVFMSKTYQQMNTFFWDSDILFFYRNYGMVASFAKYQQALHVSKPQDYSKILSDDYTNEIPEASVEKTGEIQPTNIIMIMNESFSDFKVFGDLFKDIDVTPFYSSLKENTIKGNLYVSVRGGGTCNTEFESLTGNSLIFFPSGTTPFQTYIHKDTNSIATCLQNDGYSVYAMHLASAMNWNRKNVYPFLGFPKFYSESDFENLEKVRDLATDDENYRRVIDLYEKKENEKFFCFDVTIQNHGGYKLTDDFKRTVDLSQYGNYPDAEVFLSLIKKSDDALKSLIHYFEQVDEPTMIIMYGDHQPSLSADTESWLFSLNNTENNSLNRYVTPFMIWTNYDIEEKYIDKISANYLSSLILQTANIELPVYNKFLMYMFEKYPVISTQGILDSDDNFYMSYKDIPNDAEDFDIYASLQYNNVFDKNCKQELFIQQGQ